MGTKRLFIAIDLPLDIKQQIAKFEWELTKHNLPFRFEDEQKLHVTLVFLGNTSVALISLIENALSSLVKNYQSFFLQIGQLEAFPGFKHPRVLYLNVNGELVILEKLQKELAEILKNLGFHPRSNAVFTPHITLGRLAKTPYPVNLKNTGSFIRGLKIKIPKLQFKVEKISLMESRLSSKGSTYKTLGNFSLLNFLQVHAIA